MINPPRVAIVDSARLFIRYHLTNILRFHRGDGAGLAQMALTLLALVRKNMPFVSFVTFDFSTAGNAKSFRSGFIGFNFRHFCSSIISVSLALVFGSLGRQ
jgi:hypothetical protein